MRSSTRTFAAALLSAATLASPAAAMTDNAPQTPARHPVAHAAAPSDETAGFDWGSAGIGAAAGVGASAIALAGLAGLRRRRLPQSRPIATH